MLNYQAITPPKKINQTLCSLLSLRQCYKYLIGEEGEPEHIGNGKVWVLRSINRFICSFETVMLKMK